MTLEHTINYWAEELCRNADTVSDTAFDATFKEQIISLFGEKLCGVVDNATISDAWTPNRLVLKPSKNESNYFM